jgi:hypothetical protein
LGGVQWWPDKDFEREQIGARARNCRIFLFEARRRVIDAARGRAIDNIQGRPL